MKAGEEGSSMRVGGGSKLHEGRGNEGRSMRDGGEGGNSMRDVGGSKLHEARGRGKLHEGWGRREAP